MANNEISIIVSLRDQASREFNRIAASSDAAKSKIGDLKNDLMAIGAGAGIAGLGMYMAKAAIDYGLAVDDIIDQTGAAGEEASKLLAIASATGIGTEEATKSMAKFGKSVSMAWDEAGKAAAKGEEANDMFSRLGITLEDADKTNLVQTFEKVAEKMRNMEDGADKDRVAMELFGKSGYELHDMLNLTAEQIAEFTDRAEAMGLIISTEDAAACEQLDRQMSILKGTANKLAIGIGTELIPVLQEKVTWLQTLTDEYTKMDDEQRKNIASVIEVATEIGALILVVEGLTLAFRALAAANPWIAIATGLAAAGLALHEYNTEQSKLAFANNQTPQFDPVTGLMIPVVPEDYDGSAFDKNEASNNYKPAKAQPRPAGSPVTLRPSASSAGSSSAADKAQRDLEKAQEKINDMIADLQGKIISETGTTLEGNLAKVKSEIAKMRYDIEQAAGKGVDPELIKDARTQLEQFDAVMKDKYVKSWRESWQDLKNEQSKVTADLLDDKNAQADAEYNIAKTRLDREQEDKLKAVQMDGNDAEARLAVEQWYNDEVLKLERDRQQKHRENLDTAYQQAVEHNNLLMTLEGKSQTEIDNLNRSSTENHMAELRKQLANTQLTADERLSIEQKLADDQKQIWEMNGRDLKTGWSEAVRQFQSESINYADYAKSSIDSAWSDIDSSVSGHLENIFTRNENLKDGILGMIGDISSSIEKMFADMIYQQMILQPLKNWFSGILGGMSGGSSSGGGILSSFMGKEAGSLGGFASGGVASGWSVVGEQGPELVNFSNPGRVYNARDTQNMLAGQSGPAVIMNITTPNAESFRRSSGQIYAGMNAALASGRRFM